MARGKNSTSSATAKVKAAGQPQVHPTGDVMTLDKTERARLRKLREDRDLGQKEVADKIGVTQATISNIENGKHTGQVKKSVYAKLIRYYKTKPGMAEPTAEQEAAFKALIEEVGDLTPDQYVAIRAVVKTITKTE